MKAEIKDGLLLLETENQNESAILMEWTKVNKGKISIPKKRDEFALTKFDDIFVIICCKNEA